MTDEQQLVKDTFTQYSNAFAKLDPKALVPFYHKPAILIDPSRIFSVNSEEEILKILTPLIEDLKRLDYERSETTHLGAKLLSENTALVSGIGIRIKKDETELAKFGFTYTLRKADGEWKIIAGVIHNIETVLQLEQDALAAYKASLIYCEVSQQCQQRYGNVR